MLTRSSVKFGRQWTGKVTSRTQRLQRRQLAHQFCQLDQERAAASCDESSCSLRMGRTGGGAAAGQAKRGSATRAPIAGIRDRDRYRPPKQSIWILFDPYPTINGFELSVLRQPIKASPGIPRRLPQNGLSTPVAVGSRCEDAHSGGKLVGEETILGYQTYKFESNGNPGVTQRESTWLALALDCRSLRYVVERFGDSGQLVSGFEPRALSVTLGEPDPGLFEVPTQYRELTPSQASRELRERRLDIPFGSSKADEKLLPGMAAMDRKYLNSRQYRKP